MINDYKSICYYYKCLTIKHYTGQCLTKKEYMDRLQRGNKCTEVPPACWLQERRGYPHPDFVFPLLSISILFLNIYALMLRLLRYFLCLLSLQLYAFTITSLFYTFLRSVLWQCCDMRIFLPICSTSDSPALTL